MDPFMLLPKTCFAYLSHEMISPCQSHPNSLLHPRITWSNHQQTQKPCQNILDTSSHSGSVCFIFWNIWSTEPLHDLPSAISPLYMFWSRGEVINEQSRRTCIYFHIYIHMQKWTYIGELSAFGFPVINPINSEMSLHMRGSEQFLSGA